MTNSTGSDVLVGITVTGLTSPQTLLLSLTNESALTATASVPSDFYTSIHKEPASTQALHPLAAAAHQHHVNMRSFRQPMIRSMGPKASVVSDPSVSVVISTSFVVGNTRTWIHAESSTAFSNMPATLRASRQLSDGKWAHFWVENNEWGAGKVTQGIVDDYADTFRTAGTGIYDRVGTNTQGKIWGAHPYSNLISDTTTDMHVVVGNFDKNSQPWGVVGYFYALNNFLKSSPSCTTCPNSNEALVFFLDSETIYLGSGGVDSSKSTLIHELVHMINYYERDTVRGVAFDSWLEEISAMMMQDLIETSYGIATAETSTNGYMRGWVSDFSYRCSPFEFEDSTSSSCFSYQVGSVYGAHILRKHGLPFYQDLLKSTQPDSFVALNTLLNARGDSAMKAAARINAMAAMIKNTSIPTAYQLPALSGASFSLPEILPQSFISYQSSDFPQPSTLPQGGAALQVFSASGTWTKNITIPKHSSLTIVVRQ
ncbi:MAG: hypothetical protein RL758_1417 [Pseudomonadota bacterium]